MSATESPQGYLPDLASLNADQLRLMLEQIPAVLWTTDSDLRFTASFGAGLVRLGLKPGQVIGMPLAEYLQTDDPEDRVLSSHRRVLQGECLSFDVELLGNAYEVHLEPLRDGDNGIVGCIGVALDVTLRRRAERALRERVDSEQATIEISRRFVGAPWEDIGNAIEASLERLAQLTGADHAHVAFASDDGQSYYIHHWWDTLGENGFTIPESIPRTSLEWLIDQLSQHDYLVARDLSSYPAAALRDAIPELRPARSGAWLGIRVNGEVIGGIALLWRDEATDITDAQIAPLTVLADVMATLMYRRATEERLNESRRMLSALMSNLPGMAYRCCNDHNWTMEFASDGCRELTGYTADELIGNRLVSYADLIVPEDRSMVWNGVQKGIADETAFQLQYRIKDRHGAVKWVWEQGSALYDGDGSVVALEGFISDISERKRAESDRQTFVSLVENSSDGVIMCTLDGRTLYMNPAGRALIGINRKADIAGRNVIDWYCEAHGHTQPEIGFLDAKTDGQWIGEVSLKHQDTGEPIPVRQNVFLVRHNDNEQPVCLAAMLHDLREEKHADELLLRAKRLETAGQLAGQIAHDFNNLLGPLVAYPNLIRERIPDAVDIEDMLRDMEESATRIAEINQELLTLGRRGHYNVQALDMNQVIEQVLRAITLPDSIAVARELAPCPPPVLGGGAQLVRALSNIVANACDAMTGGGTLTIRTSACRLSERQLRGRTVPSGVYVRIDVSDSGHGIPNDVINRVFDPFFTTRKADKGRGSGLGLAVVYSVVEDHNGYVDVTSTPGTGTTFSIYLPVAADECAPARPREDVLSGRGERILVVDDDRMQLRIVERMLRELSYEVTPVTSGEAALESIRESDYDLILLDMLMEGIDGAETFLRIRQINPQQRALIISGYAGTERVAAALAAGVLGFIQKPVSASSLARMVRQAIEGRLNVSRQNVPESKPC